MIKRCDNHLHPNESKYYSQTIFKQAKHMNEVSQQEI